jgi:transposase, IS5 family
MRFLGLGLGDPVPDANTIWTFRETLTRAGAIERLLTLFDQQRRAQGYLAMSGQLVDATIVSAPKQRNTRAEKQALRDGRVPEDWRAKPPKLSQKDRGMDARWTVKTTKARPRAGETPMVDLAIPEFGYQNHVSADRPHRLIRRWLVTDAAAHSGARLAELLDRGNTAAGVWADTPPSAGVRTARANAAKSTVRAQIEHIFADQKHRMGLFVGTIGLARATTNWPRQPGPQHAPPALARTSGGAYLIRGGRTPESFKPLQPAQPPTELSRGALGLSCELIDALQRGSETLADRRFGAYRVRLLALAAAGGG